jgi:CheY-like chemotaxis protein
MVRSLPKTVRLPRQRSTRLEHRSDEENAFRLFAPSEIDFWERFHDYLLQNHTKHTARVRLSYCKKYYPVLEEANAQILLTLPSGKRIHAMKSLAALSKYLGCYNEWKDIRERYQLKWSEDNNLQVFKNMTNPNRDFESMTTWLKNSMANLPRGYGNILLFDALTGLRPDEACKSVSLIHNDLEGYYNKDTSVLEHFKFPQLFIRRTKKAYISVVSDLILNIATECSSCSYNSLRLALRRRGLEMNMSYCRKIFATFLRVNSIEQEIIDLLQGRTPNSVLVILEVIMPKVDGLELYTQLKEKDSGINICFLTASSEPYREELPKEKYNQLSRDLFLEMPLPTSELIREVKKLLQIPQ